MILCRAANAERVQIRAEVAGGVNVGSAETAFEMMYCLHAVGWTSAHVGAFAARGVVESAARAVGRPYGPHASSAFTVLFARLTATRSSLASPLMSATATALVSRPAP